MEPIYIYFNEVEFDNKKNIFGFGKKDQIKKSYFFYKKKNILIPV